MDWSGLGWHDVTWQVVHMSVSNCQWQQDHYLLVRGEGKGYVGWRSWLMSERNLTIRRITMRERYERPHRWIGSSQRLYPITCCHSAPRIPSGCSGVQDCGSDEKKRDTTPTTHGLVYIYILYSRRWSLDKLKTDVEEGEIGRVRCSEPWHPLRVP